MISSYRLYSDNHVTHYKINCTISLLFVFSNCAIDFVHVALCVVYIRASTVCSHFMLSRTF